MTGVPGADRGRGHGHTGRIGCPPCPEQVFVNGRSSGARSATPRRPKWLGRCTECGAWSSLVEERPGGPAAAPPPRRRGDAPRRGRPDRGRRSADRRRPSWTACSAAGSSPARSRCSAASPASARARCCSRRWGAWRQRARGACSCAPRSRSSRCASAPDGCTRSRRRCSSSPRRRCRRSRTASARSRPTCSRSTRSRRCSIPEIASAPGSVAQVREGAHRLVRLAKERAMATVLVGHVTKDGSLAGPRALEHVVDTVLAFEGDRHHALRMLHALKHRYGTTNELGVFEMAEAGMTEVLDPSAMFLADRRPGLPGSVVTATMEGVRPLLVEVQALVSETARAGAAALRTWARRGPPRDAARRARGPRRVRRRWVRRLRERRGRLPGAGRGLGRRGHRRGRERAVGHAGARGSRRGRRGRARRRAAPGAADRRVGSARRPGSASGPRSSRRRPPTSPGIRLLRAEHIGDVLTRSSSDEPSSRGDSWRMREVRDALRDRSGSADTVPFQPGGDRRGPGIVTAASTAHRPAERQWFARRTATRGPVRAASISIGSDALRAPTRRAGAAAARGPGPDPAGQDGRADRDRRRARRVVAVLRRLPPRRRVHARSDCRSWRRWTAP